MDPIPFEKAGKLVQGAPGPVAVGGETFVVAQPTKADFVTLSKLLKKVWEQRQSATIARVSAELKDLPADVKEIAVRAAVGHRVSPDNAALSELLLDAEGCAAWLWILARKHHPDLTLARARELVTDENVDDVCGQLLEAAELKDAAPNSAGRTG
jgi:hypothetical protein